MATVRTQQVPEPPPNPVPELLQLMSSPERDVRLAAVERFGALLVRGNPWLPPSEQPHAVRASSRLLLLFEEDPDADVALAAGLTLVVMAWPAHFAVAHTASRLADWERAGAPAAPLAALRRALAPDRPSPQATLEPLAALTVGPAGPGALAVLTLFGQDARAVAPQLSRQLGRAPVSERWRVALALAGLGCATELVPALADADPRVRVAASLAQLRTTGGEAPPNAAVVPWLADDRSVVQELAIRAVARLAEPPAAAVRTVAARLDEPLLHRAVEQTLQALGPRAAPAVPILVRHLIAARQDPESLAPAAARGIAPETQRSASIAIAALGAIGSGATAAVEPLALLAAEDDHGSQRFSHACGQALARIAPEQAVPILMQALERDLGVDRDGWWNSALTLRAMGDAVVPELARIVTILERGSTPARANALLVLAAGGARALPALPAVLQQLDGTDYWLWPTALDVVRSLGPAAAATAMPKLSQRFGEVSSHLRMHCVFQLHRLGGQAEPLLLRGSNDDDPLVRWEADKSLLHLPKLSAAGATRIRDLLAIAEPKDAAARLTNPAPWRHLLTPLTEAAPVAPNLKALLPPLLEHPDFPAFAAIAKVLVHDLCPAARGHQAWDKLIATADRTELRQAVVDLSTLRAWVTNMAGHADTDARAAAGTLLPLLAAPEGSKGR
jgi:hypothetical protein